MHSSAKWANFSWPGPKPTVGMPNIPAVATPFVLNVQWPTSGFIDNLRVINTRDTDSDGEPDAADIDDDNDGLRDTWENDFFGGLTNAVPGDDEDRDGANNYGEYVADTDPGNSHSVFEVRMSPLQSPRTISFNSSTGRLYDVQCSTNLISGEWVNLDVNVHGNGHETEVPDPSPAACRAYRIRVRLP